MGIVDHKQSIMIRTRVIWLRTGSIGEILENDENYESDETRPRFGLMHSLTP